MVMNIIENINKTVVPEMNWAYQKNVSYTQFSTWMECPRRWKEQYIDKIKQPPSIYLSLLDKKTINNIIKNYKQ